MHTTWLFINTSPLQAEVGLFSDGHFLQFEPFDAARAHSEKLLTHIQSLLARAHVELAHLAGIVVDRGPGSFTGVRVGVATANALGFSLGIPVVALTEFDIAHTQLRVRDEQAGDRYSRYLVLIHGIKDIYYVGFFNINDDRTPSLQTMHAYAISDLSKQVSSTDHLFVYPSAQSAIGSFGSRIEALYSSEDERRNALEQTISSLSLNDVSEKTHDKFVIPLYVARPHITIKKNLPRTS